MQLRASRLTTKLRRVILALVLGSLVAVTPLAATAQQPSTIPIAWVAPPGFERTSLCGFDIGERWANRPPGPDIRSETGVAGPSYLVNQGRLVAVHNDISQADLAAGRSWRGIPIQYWGQALTIDHIDILPTPAHEGFEEPHYHVISYLVNPAEQGAMSCQPQ